MNALAPSRLPINPTLAKSYDLDAGKWRVLVEQIFPAAKEIESVLMALEYCRVRNLDIYKRPVHIVPMWSSEKKKYVETVWPGISEIRTTAARTRQYAGLDEITFGPIRKRPFKADDKSIEVEYPEWAKATVYRMIDGNRCAFTATVWWDEAFASGKGGVPNAMWQKRPRGQLAKCAEAAALRCAFPEEVGADLSAEEMEGQVIDITSPVASAEVPPPPPAKRIAEQPAEPKEPRQRKAKEQPAQEQEITDVHPEDVQEADSPPPPPTRKAHTGSHEAELIAAERYARNCEEPENFEDWMSEYGHLEERLQGSDYARYQAAKERAEANSSRGRPIV